MDNLDPQSDITAMGTKAVIKKTYKEHIAADSKGIWGVIMVGTFIVTGLFTNVDRLSPFLIKAMSPDFITRTEHILEIKEINKKLDNIEARMDNMHFQTVNKMSGKELWNWAMKEAEKLEELDLNQGVLKYLPEIDRNGKR